VTGLTLSLKVHRLGQHRASRSCATPSGRLRQRHRAGFEIELLRNGAVSRSRLRHGRVGRFRVSRIGRRSYAAFGNSTGDREMLEWTGAGAGRARLKMLLLHEPRPPVLLARPEEVIE
jgi:hypothetical protein